MHMNGNRTPLFITASLLVATLALALPDLELETGFEEPAPTAIRHDTSSARRPSLTAERSS